jgi:hypothetical protein
LLLQMKATCWLMNSRSLFYLLKRWAVNLVRRRISQIDKVNLLGVLHKIIKVNCVSHLLIYCCKMAFRISILFSKFLYLNWTTNLAKRTLRGASECRVQTVLSSHSP